MTNSRCFSWDPIITDNDKFEVLLDQISQSIIKSEHFNIGINSGEAGKLLFISSLFEYNNHEELLDFIIKRSYKVTEKGCLGVKMDLSISTGLCGLLYVLRYLISKGYLPKERFASSNIDKYMYDVMLVYCKQKKYDFLSGAMGIALYFFNNKEYSIVNGFFDMLIKDFERDNDDRIFFINEKYNSKSVVNLGFAHGLSGILAFISLAKKEDNLFERYYDVSLGLAKYLLSLKIENRKSLFPPVIFWGEKNEPMSSRLSWCYGDLSIGYSLFLFSTAFKERQYQEISLKILLDATKRTNLEKEGINDACLCHGTSGIAHIYNRIYQMTSIEEFKKASDYWFDQTSKMVFTLNETAGFSFFLTEDEKKIISPYAFLNGISGVGLSILSGMTPISPSWDRLLLLS